MNLKANLISNLIKNFKFEPNFNLVELELEPEPCDIGWTKSLKMIPSFAV